MSKRKQSWVSKWQKKLAAQQKKTASRKISLKKSKRLDKLCWSHKTAELSTAEMGSLLPNQKEKWPVEKRFCAFYKLMVIETKREALDGSSQINEDFFEFDPTSLTSSANHSLWYGPSRENVLNQIIKYQRAYAEFCQANNFTKISPKSILCLVDCAPYCGLSYLPFEPKPPNAAERLKKFLLSLQED